MFQIFPENEIDPFTLQDQHLGPYEHAKSQIYQQVILEKQDLQNWAWHLQGTLAF